MDDSAEGLDLTLKGDPVPCLFVTGIAGSGKTYLLRETVRRDPGFGALCSTTGISAINLGVITIHSLLGFFDSVSLQENFLRGSILRKLKKLRDSGVRNLILDEVSMLPAEQLDLIYAAIAELNAQPGEHAHEPFGLIICGDFMQLSPVKAKWAFEADCWDLFADNTLRLTKVWRQADAAFLEAINLTRAGKGAQAAEMLCTARHSCFFPSTDEKWEGATILPKNEMVDRYNMMRAARLPGRLIREPVRRWGMVQRPEWKKQIGLFQEFKVGSYVMILANSYDYSDADKYNSPRLIFANGDCAYIKDYDGASKQFTLELVRKDEDGEPIVVKVGRITRDIVIKERPENGVEGKDFRRNDKKDGKGWIVGEITYHPLRYAWAATVHKTQGLSLDKVQMNISDGFFGQPAMTYVAVSRCRTMAGLRIVGDKALYAKRCKLDARTLKWL